MLTTFAMLVATAVIVGVCTAFVHIHSRERGEMLTTFAMLVATAVIVGLAIAFVCTFKREW